MDDLISRQAAIDAICKEGTRLERNGTVAMCEIKQWCVDLLERLPSAQPEKRTDERTETHGVCLDAISRRAAIDALGEEPYALYRDDYMLGRRNQYREDKNALQQLPSAQPEIIMCKECINYDLKYNLCRMGGLQLQREADWHCAYAKPCRGEEHETEDT